MVVGSIPTVGACLHEQQGKASAPLAQWIARWTSNPKVAGSSPAGGNALPSQRARLAQSVARGSHNPKVVSSILAPRIVFLMQKRHLRDSNPRPYAYWAYALTN
jgi:hypothetical protein